MTDECLNDFRSRIIRLLSPLIPEGTRVALLDFPNHGNVGDSAIWAGEVFILKHVLRAKIIDSAVAGTPLRSYPPNTLILIHGGGNLGDIWPYHQIYRENILKKYRSHQIIQLPQTVDFTNKENFDRFMQIARSHEDFSIFLRDKQSYDIAEAFSVNKRYLCPDLAFALGRMKRLPPQYPILGLLRTDKEKVHQTEIPGGLYVCDWVKGRSAFTTKSSKLINDIEILYPSTYDIIKPLTIWFRNRSARAEVKRGIAILSMGQVVVTDRLHVHILCTLLGIKHVVLDNAYRKIGRYRDTWGSGVGFCKSAKTLSDAVELAISLQENQTLL